MKRLFLIIVILFLLASPAIATINYCDYTSGDDGTGDGSAGNPYKTLNKCTTGLTGGDECRMAKTAAHTALSGTVTLTDKSATISTTSDLTSEIAQYDMVGLDDGYWYEVTSRDASSITLTKVYRGTGGSGLTLYKMNGHDIGDQAGSGTGFEDTNANGSSFTSRITVSGGWNLSTESQDGETYYISTGATPGGSFVIDNYGYTFENIRFARIYAVRIWYVYWVDFDDIGVYATNQDGIEGVGGNSGSTYSNIKCVDAGDDCIAESGRDMIMSNIVAKVPNSRCLYLSSADGVHAIDNITCQSPGGAGMRFDNTSVFFINNIDIDTCASFNYGIQFYGGGIQAYAGDIAINDCYIGVFAYTQADVVVYNYQPTSVTTEWSSSQRVFPSIRYSRKSGTVHNDGQIGDNYVMTKDSTDARSGYCIKMSPTNASYWRALKIGSYLVSSTASDIDLSAYIKDDASWNGSIQLAIVREGEVIDGWDEPTLTTSYVKQTLTAPAAELVANTYIDLWIKVLGSAGSVYIDDFAAE